MRQARQVEPCTYSNLYKKEKSYVPPRRAVLFRHAATVLIEIVVPYIAISGLFDLFSIKIKSFKYL